MDNEFVNVKGSFDYLPEKQLVRERIRNVLCQAFQRYGYAPVETPILCYYELLASKYSEGADILKEMYRLSDQGKRELGLRYDLTVCFAKLISMNKTVAFPFKRYEIGKVFRDGPVKLGRNREFTQCDVDVVGVSSCMPEAEFFMMSVDVYKTLGLDIEIQYNNRKLLSGLIQYVGIDPAKADDIILVVDKMAKMSRNELIVELGKAGASADESQRLLAVFGKTYAELVEMFSQTEDTNVSNDNIQAGLTELAELQGYLADSGIEDHLVFAPHLARGIGIYTGTVWEIFLKDKSLGVSLGAGGRYDKIIGNFIGDGKEYPAVGMTFGMDVIYEALAKNEQGDVRTPVEVYIVPMDTRPYCLKLARELRNRGVCVDLELNTAKVKKSLTYANKMNIPWAVVIGENEVASGQFELKNMSTAEKKTFRFDELDQLVQTLRAK